MKFFFSLLLLLATIGCATSSTDVTFVDSNNIQAAGVTQTTPKQLQSLSGKWNLIPALPADTATGRIPFVDFDTDSHKVTGNTGCNTFRGGYTAADGNLAFGKNLVTTRMACPGYDEAAFLKNLLRVNRYEIKGDTLVLQIDTAPLSYWLKIR